MNAHTFISGISVIAERTDNDAVKLVKFAL